jgi:hypothetical protein
VADLKSKAAPPAEGTQLTDATRRDTASVNAAWQYNDVPDKMGEHGVEHHAWVNSVEKDQARLLLVSGDSGTSIMIKTIGVMNGDASDAKLWNVTAGHSF